MTDPVPRTGLDRRRLLAGAAGLPLAAWAQSGAGSGSGSGETRPEVPLFLGMGERPREERRLHDRLAACLGVRWRIEQLPWARAQQQAAQGVGLMFGLTRSAERERRLRFSVPVRSTYLWALVREGDADWLTRLADLDGQTVCWGRGSNYGTDFEAAGLGRMQPMEGQGDAAALRMLAAGRCRAALLSLEQRHAAEARQHPDIAEALAAGLRLTPRPLQERSLHYVTGRDGPWTGLIDALDRCASRARAEAERPAAR